MNFVPGHELSPPDTRHQIPNQVMPHFQVQYGKEPDDFSSLSSLLVVVAGVDLSEVDFVVVVIVVSGPAEVGSLSNPRSLLMVIMVFRFSFALLFVNIIKFS